MPDTRSPILFYASILEPWTRLAIGVPNVIGMRLTLMPWLWVTNPVQANQEVSRMVMEKQAAFMEANANLITTPAQWWFNGLAIGLSTNPQARFCRALIDTSRRAARPANKRVSANKRRLSKRSLRS